MEIDQNGRQTQWKTISLKDGLNEIRPQWKKTSIEDDLNGRRPQCILMSDIHSFILIAHMTKFQFLM